MASQKRIFLSTQQGYFSNLTRLESLKPKLIYKIPHPICSISTPKNMRRLAAAFAPPPLAAAAAPKLHPWKSPIPYLFGGLSLTMLLIAGALIVLACSYRKRFSGNSSEKEPPAAAPADVELVMEPKILVIMAGDDMPTFLATPATAAAADVPRRCNCSALKQRDGDQNQNPSPS